MQKKLVERLTNYYLCNTSFDDILSLTVKHNDDGSWSSNAGVRGRFKTLGELFRKVKSKGFNIARVDKNILKNLMRGNSLTIIAAKNIDPRVQGIYPVYNVIHCGSAPWYPQDVSPLKTDGSEGSGVIGIAPTTGDLTTASGIGASVGDGATGDVSGGAPGGDAGGE